MTRDELEQAVRLKGQGSPDVTSHEPEADVRLHQPPAQRDLRVDLWNILNASGQWMGRAELAKAVGLKNTDHVYEKLEALVSEGYLLKYETPYRPGMTKKWYRVK